MPSYIACPNCGEHEFHRSHTRNIIERLRSMLLHQNPYRCHSCNYRGWILVKVVSERTSHKNIILYLFIFFISIIVGLIVGSTLN